MAKPANLLLPYFVEGAHWEGLSLTVTDANGNPPAASLASVQMDFVLERKGGTRGLRLTSDSGIVIDDAATWAVSIAPVVHDLSPGKYFWDMRFVDANGVVSYLLEGIVNVLESVTAAS